MEVVVTTGLLEVCRAKLQSNHHHQHPVFLQARCPSCRPTNSVKALREEISHSMDLLTPSSPGGLPTLSLTTNSSWLPWGGLPCLSSALWCQYPNLSKFDNCWFYGMSVCSEICKNWAPHVLLFKVIQGQRMWHKLIRCLRLPVSDLQWPWAYLMSFLRQTVIMDEKHIFSYPMNLIPRWRGSHWNSVMPV